MLLHRPYQVNVLGITHHKQLQYNIHCTLVDLFSVLLTCEELFMKESQFMSNVMSMTLDLPRELFDSFAHHLSVCGVERRSCKLKELRRYDE